MKTGPQSFLEYICDEMLRPIKEENGFPLTL